MLILRYGYDLEDGTVKRVSCCLKKCSQYSVGRSNNNKLRIKNDKSISRQHVLVKWDYNEDGQAVVWITNVGKLTAVGDKYLKVDEAISFNLSQESDGRVLLLLGAKPITLNLTWEAAVWSLPPVDSSYLNTLNDLGVTTDLQSVDCSQITGILSSTFERKTTDIVRLIYGVLNEGCLLLDSSILKSISEMDTSGVLENDFDDNWRGLIRNTQNQLFRDIQIDNKKFRDYFHDIVLYFISSKYKTVLRWLEPICKGIFKEFLVFENVTQFEDILLFGRPQRVERCVIVSEVALTKYPIKVHTPGEFLDAIVRNKYNSLPFLLKTPIGTIQQQNEKNVSSSVVQKRENVPESVGPAPLKKRRLTRKKIQPLDSLNFFAGGGTPIQSQTFGSTRKMESSGTDEKLEQVKTSLSRELQLAEEVPSKSPTTHNTLSSLGTQKHDADEVDVIRKNAVLENPFSSENKTNTSNSIKEKPGKLGRPSVLSKTAVKAQVESDLKSQMVSLTDNKVQNTQGQVKEGAKVSTPRNQTRGRTQITSGNTLTDKSISKKLVEVIQSAKNEEVRRVQSTIVTINPEEMTEEALSSFQTLNIKPNDTLIRPNRNRGGAERINDGVTNDVWKGRKNFKNFVKVWPRSWNSGNDKHRTNHNSNSSSIDFVKNSAFLITRDYVPLRRYDAHSAFRDSHSHIGELINSRSFPGGKVADVQTGFDSDEAVLRQMATMQQSNPGIEYEDQDQPGGKHLFVSIEGEDDDDFGHGSDEDLMVEFSGANTTVEVPSTYKRRSTNGLVQLDAPAHTSRMASVDGTSGDNMDTGYNDDDDDDDEPRFVFRSRR